MMIFIRKLAYVSKFISAQFLIIKRSSNSSLAKFCSVFGDKIFQQSIGISMGTNCVILLAGGLFIFLWSRTYRNTSTWEHSSKLTMQQKNGMIAIPASILWGYIPLHTYMVLSLDYCVMHKVGYWQTSWCYRVFECIFYYHHFAHCAFVYMISIEFANTTFH
jgi:hypothetical protein